MNPTTFDAWLTGQLAKGLVDIKFAISPGKEVTSAAVQDEILAAEAAIEFNLLKAAPQMNSAMPEDIFAIIKEVSLH